MKQRRMKQYDLTGCPLIGTGAKGSVYRYNDELILKVFHEKVALEEIEEEVRVSRTAFIAGIPTAISFGIGKVGDRYAAVFELLDSMCMSEELAGDQMNYQAYAKMLSDIARIIHSTDGVELGFSDGLGVVYEWIDTGLAYADPELEAGVRKMVDDLPKVSTLIHGDLHTGNIICTKREPLLIDMGTLSVGHPIIELANLYMFYVGLGEFIPEKIEEFMKISYSLSKAFFRSALSSYLGTEDSSKLDEVQDKASILAYTRLLRWVYKKGMDPDADAAERRDYYLKRIRELTERWNTLDFSVVR